jgi:single-strand DNA-binding protein
MATNSSYKDKQSGEWKEQTEWHNIVAWQRTAEVAAEYLKKGRQVYIEGRLQTRSWDDKETGAKKYMTEIVVNEMVLVGGKRDGESSGEGGSRARGAASGGSHFDQRSTSGEDNFSQTSANSLEITDEDIPF